MARTTNSALRVANQDKILDTFLALILAKGFEGVSIQDVLQTLDISKGAFYYYFRSKQHLLQALIDRMITQAEPVILPIAHDDSLNATDKINQIFMAIGHWKRQRNKEIMAFLGVWYDDNNAVFRHYIRKAAAAHYQPMFAAIIQEGIEQGLFTFPDADRAAVLLHTNVSDLSETMSMAMLDSNLEGDAKRKNIENIVQAYTMAITRILNAPEGSLCLIDQETLDYWIEQTV